MPPVRVVVATPYPKSQRLLERYVGGCLKGIATVEATGCDDFDFGACDILVFYERSPNESTFRQKLPYVELIGLRFIIQACGVRKLAALDPKTRVGVVAGHRPCANMLLREILDSGIYQPRFVTGAFGDIDSMDADVFAVAEEMEETFWTAYSGDRSRVIVLPRSLSNSSVAELINAASNVLLKR
ncbi:MAG: hypothetical protein ACM3X4_11800 [Ignavibacteriales bacterium]